MKEYKVAVVGLSGVGKSTLLYRFRHDRYQDYVTSTVGAEFFFLDRVAMNGRRVSIWDTAYVNMNDLMTLT